MSDKLKKRRKYNGKKKMTIEEYYEEQDRIRSEYLSQSYILDKNYAISNSPAKVGDIVTDGYNIINVDGILVNTQTTPPSCIYVGPVLTKKKTTG